MNAEYKPESEQTIVYPKEGTVVIPKEIDFVYIMRKDTEFAMDPIAQTVCIGKELDEVKSVLYEAYDTFFAQMTDILHAHFSFKGNMQLHVYDAHYLRRCCA